MISNIIIAYAFFLFAKLRGFRWISIISLYILVFIAILAYPIQRMQFTTTACLLGIAAITLLYLYERTKNKINIIFSVILIILSFMERRKAGVVMICFWTLALFYLFLAEKTRKRFIFIVLEILLLISIWGIDRIDKRLKYAGDNEYYEEYDQYRLKYQDYSKPTYDEAEELYQSVGWDRETYNLVQSLIFIDSDINKESFQTLVESGMVAGRLTVSEAIYKLHKVIRSSSQTLVTIGLFGILVIILCMLLIVKWRELSWAQRLRLLAPEAGAILIYVYVLFCGRVFERITILIIFPAIIMMGLEILQYLSSDKNILRGCISVFVAILIFFDLVSLDYSLYDLKKRDDYSENCMNQLVEYANENPDNIYIHDYTVCSPTNSYNPFVNYYYDKPTNLIISGGSYTYSGCYINQLKTNGLTKIDGETLLENNVYFVFDKSKANTHKLVLKYLQKEYGNSVKMEIIKRLNSNITICKYFVEKS